MDPTLVSAEPAGLYGWIMSNGQIIAFFAQIIYWFGMLLLLFYAVWQYKRWVNFQLGIGRSGKLRDAADASGDGGAKPNDAAGKGAEPSVDEFVE